MTSVTRVALSLASKSALHVLPGLLRAAALSLAACCSMAMASSPWMTSYETALETARQTGRPVLTIFTGSDWCPHCRTLENNVLESDAFLQWAESRVVLLMIDLPQHGISPAVRSERSQVCIKYGVRTFPSALLIGLDGQKITHQTGYTGQPPATWIAHFDKHMPVAISEIARSDDGTSRVLPSLGKAVETAKTSNRPILLLVSKRGDASASSHVAALIKDPEFEAFAHDHFVVATVPSTDRSDPQSEQNIEHLLGGVDLGPEGVEMIVTDDGQTPLFSQSAAQPPHRLVNGLRRFLSARQATRLQATRR